MFLTCHDMGPPFLPEHSISVSLWRLYRLGYPSLLTFPGGAPSVRPFRRSWAESAPLCEQQCCRRRPSSERGALPARSSDAPRVGPARSGRVARLTRPRGQLGRGGGGGRRSSDEKRHCPTLSERDRRLAASRRPAWDARVWLGGEARREHWGAGRLPGYWSFLSMGDCDGWDGAFTEVVLS